MQQGCFQIGFLLHYINIQKEQANWMHVNPPGHMSLTTGFRELLENHKAQLEMSPT